MKRIPNIIGLIHWGCSGDNNCMQGPYDIGVLRVRKEYAWRSGSFTPTNEAHYVYDGMLVIQERNANNIPLATYTRGLDLSSSRQGAGGIGGLLARTDNGLWNGSGTEGAHTYYSADGNGNVTCLLNSKQIVVGRYIYDPYGYTLSLSGPQAEANPYRFSSKEYMVNSGLNAYGYRFYEPSLQRWLNRDPLGDYGHLSAAESSPMLSVFPLERLEGPNLFVFDKNNPVSVIDPDGRKSKSKMPAPRQCGPRCKEWKAEKDKSNCLMCCVEQFEINEAISPGKGTLNFGKLHACESKCMLTDGEKGSSL